MDFLVCSLIQNTVDVEIKCQGLGRLFKVVVVWRMCSFDVEIKHLHTVGQIMLKVRHTTTEISHFLSL